MNNRLDYLIKELSPSAPVPSDADGKWRLFRALVNVREPKPISDEFLAEQDKLLSAVIAEKGITDVAYLRPVYIWRGDITTLKVGAIVNAANSAMLGCFVPSHACIDNAIHTFAGVQLRLECDAIMRKQRHPEPTGQAKITAAYNLPCEYILHTVGPIVDGRLTGEHRRLLASCYRSCLELAEENIIKSVAFCCISTGEFRFPNEDAASIALAIVTEFLKSGGSVKKVVFNVFTERDERIYKEILG